MLCLCNGIFRNSIIIVACGSSAFSDVCRFYQPITVVANITLSWLSDHNEYYRKPFFRNNLKHSRIFGSEWVGGRLWFLFCSYFNEPNYQFSCKLTFSNAAIQSRDFRYFSFLMYMNEQNFEISSNLLSVISMKLFNICA